MTEPVCATACGRPSPDAFLCRGCTYRLERTYAEMPAQLRELDLTITRQANAGRSSGNIKHTKKSEHSLPFDLTTSDLARAARNTLSTQIRALCESRRLGLPAIKATADMALWLATNVQSIRQDEAAVEFFTEATTLARKLRAATDSHDQHTAGPCTAKITEAQVTSNDDGTVISLETTERECGAKMRMRPHSPVITCRECGTQYNTQEQMRWALDQQPDMVARIGFIDASLVTAGYIRPGTAIKWVQRDSRRPTAKRQFFPWQEDEDENGLYRMGDFTDYAKALMERREKAKAERQAKTEAA